ncbi:MAG: glutamine--fructose-6-phosphate aminotransferase, partial [Gemmatimonadetes bacterium]|nr:glutamine--fructose-6-phosphate aminotransferase [Gemmatimonadota bacterium]
MCGIVGYVGFRPAADLIIRGLRRLEYRGYDSAGLAVLNGDGLVVTKASGKLSSLEKKLGPTLPQGTVGLGHTRWATHGAPTTTNAHPHTDQTGRIAVIHNGIIENAGALRTALEQRNHTFESETDTEVLAHLIGELYQGDLELAVAAALREVDGAYGIAVISADEPDCLVAARKGSPLIVGVGDGEWFVASDASALLEHTRSVVYLDDGEMVVLSRDGYRVRS